MAHKEKNNTTKIVVIIILILIIAWTGTAYNGLITKKNNVDGAWGDVQTQYQRRVDLIPNLVNVAKESASFQQETFTEITQLRSQWQTATSQNAQVQTATAIDGLLSKLLVTVENYPDLNIESFLSLQDELAGTENRVAVARTRYNDAVKRYNTATEKIPTNLIANLFGFEQRSFFKATTSGAENAPVVDFS
jgi:LemA protein